VTETVHCECEPFQATAMDWSES